MCFYTMRMIKHWDRWQRSFEVSIPGDIQNSMQHNPEQLAWTDPALRWEISPGFSPEVSSNLNHTVWFYVWASFDTLLGYNFWPLLETSYHVGGMFNLPRKEAGATDNFFPFNLCNIRSDVNIQGLLAACSSNNQGGSKTMPPVKEDDVQARGSWDICDGNKPEMTADIQTAPCPGCRLNSCT